jgi:hypothetical protein
MRTLVIPDIHNKVGKAEKILQSIPHDKAIFLGDYFDSFEEEPDNLSTIKTAQFINRHINDPNTIFVQGNHDAHYMFNRGFLRGSGYTPEKAKLIQSLVSPQTFGKMSLYTVDQGFNLSHAGFHPKLFMHPVKGMDYDYINGILKQAVEGGINNVPHPALQPGRARGGINEVPGLTWTDWDNEFVPISGFNQIVGHSSHREPQFKNTSDSTNLDLDTNLGYVGMIDNGKLDVLKV